MPMILSLYPGLFHQLKKIYSDMKSASRTIALHRNANKTNLIIQTH